MREELRLIKRSYLVSWVPSWVNTNGKIILTMIFYFYLSVYFSTYPPPRRSGRDPLGGVGSWRSLGVRVVQNDKFSKVSRTGGRVDVRRVSNHSPRLSRSQDWWTEKTIGQGRTPIDPRGRIQWSFSVRVGSLSVLSKFCTWPLFLVYIKCNIVLDEYRTRKQNL